MGSRATSIAVARRQTLQHEAHSSFFGDEIEDQVTRRRVSEAQSISEEAGTPRSIKSNELVDESKEALKSDADYADDAAETDKIIIQHIYNRVKDKKLHTEQYLALFAFLLLTMLYLVVLYLQANSTATYETSTAHFTLLPDGLTGLGGFTFASTNAVYDWLDETVIQSIWSPTNCGNGVCERPEEYQAFGSFGCPSDCGNNGNLSQIIITLKTSFNSDDERNASSWNLCLSYPRVLCWFEEAAVFTDLLGSTKYALDIPDGNWTLNLDAPYGGVTGSVTYNSTYVWPAPDPIKAGDVLVTWDRCAANEAETSLGMCREAAGEIVTCAIDTCTDRGQLLDGSTGTAELFIDLVGECNANSVFLDAFHKQTCPQIRKMISTNGVAVLDRLACNSTASPPPPQGRRLLSTTAQQKSVNGGRKGSDLPKRRMALAELNVNRDDVTAMLWKALGSSDQARLFNLQVATQRALYTWVSDKCLANIPVNVSNTRRMSAFFCTYFGGPEYLDGCVYNNTAGNATLSSDQDLAQEMQAIHAGMNITQEQQSQFVDIFLLALQSVATMDTANLVAFENRLRQLDTEIVDTTKEGCPYVASRLSWSVGRTHESEVKVGDIVTWVWTDDEPHSIRASNGFGISAVPPFQGMGTGRLIVSNNTVCKPDNIGKFSVDEYPMPCILTASNAVGTSFFSFSKVFTTVGNYSYNDGRFDDSTYGYVVVKEAISSNEDTVGSLARECSPGCPIGQLRNGICNSVCDTMECGFDGGDCQCSPGRTGGPLCTCPDGQTHSTDGPCCESFGVGLGLEFPFFISTWGPDVVENDNNFLPKNGPPLFRYVATLNRVLIGMVIKQTRLKNKPCTHTRFTNLYPDCLGGKSEAPYGVNPVFLPKSSLFNEIFAENDTTYYANYSLGFDNNTLRNELGVPYGFFSNNLGGKPSFEYFFDINYDSDQAQRSLQYLRDGFFMDNATSSVNVELITYNGLQNFFTLFKVELTFQYGGKVAATYDIQSVSSQPYRRSIDKFRFVLELIFAACVFWNVLEEAKEYYSSYRRTGSFLAHFYELWNFIDFISLGFMLAAIGLWTNYIVNQVNKFNIQRRYPIYDIVSMDVPGQYWNIEPPGTGFENALLAIKRVERMVTFRTYYMALNGINVLLMVLRTLKLMDFQPRMGTITRTVAAAFPDLVHFFIVFFVTFFGFAMYGHLVFGNSLEDFRSFGTSLVICFAGLLGNDRANDELIQLRGWQLVAGAIFWWSFIVIMVFIILQLLLAIIVEAFIQVRSQYEDYPSMPGEVLGILRRRTRRLMTPVWTDKTLLKILSVLGAEKVGWLVEEKAALAEIERQRVVKVDGRELSMEQLERVLTRAAAHQMAPGRKLKAAVEPHLIADVVFDRFSGSPAPVEEHANIVEMVTQEMEMLQAEMDDLKVVLASLENALKIMDQEVPTRFTSIGGSPGLLTRRPSSLEIPQ